MVPRSILRQLNRLRRRERLLGVTWAAARSMALLGAALVVACLIDFFVDLYRETPYALRLILLGVQIALGLAAGVFVLRALLRRMSDNELALAIEEKVPEWGHRLISTVQLNRPNADIAGMSPEMIAFLTRQAEHRAAGADFACVTDGRRIRWAFQTLAPVILVVVFVSALWPETVRVLLARQLLQDREIPRSLEIESVRAQQVWPAGEEGVLRFNVRGAFGENLRGEVRLDGKDGVSERHELLFESQDRDGTATFFARVPPSARDFSYRAWLKDGRTHRSADVHFEPRPVVRRQQAWVRLPAYVGIKPNGQPYEEPQKGADLTYRLAGSSARVAIETQKPIVRATVELLGPPHGIAAAPRPGARAETVRRSVELAVEEDGCKAEGVFDFQPEMRPDLLSALTISGGVGCPVTPPWAGLALLTSNEPMQTETAYRIVVRDAFDLENGDKPRRGIHTAPVDAPEVALLPESLAAQGSVPTDDDEIEGIPILLGQRVPLAYESKAPYGLSHARLRYRVIPRNASREDDADPGEQEFLPLPLGATRGQTSKANKKAQEEFFAVPSDDPDKLDGREGGGRVDFDSSGIPDGEGGLLRLQEGDRIQFYVEVFGRADPDGIPGRSAVREKEIVSQKDFWAWIEKKEDHKERIRELEEKQRGLSGTTSLLTEDRPRFAPERTIPREPFAPTPDAENVMGRSWQLLGPFANEKDTGHVRIYPPETEPTALGKDYEGIAGKIRWRPHQSTNDKVDLQKFFDRGEAGVAYAVCWVKPAYRMRVTLATGSDDGIKVWYKRKLVLDRAVHREAVPGDDKTSIQLDDGWQEILVKVDNRFGSWAFYLDLLDGTGKPLRGPQLRVRTTAPTATVDRFVKNWLILGPFGHPLNPGGTNHTRTFPPEGDPVDLKRKYTGRNGEIRWREYRGDDGKIDLLKACSLAEDKSQGAVAYAVCWVRSDKKRLAVLATGSDDGIKVWINRKIVHDKAEARPAAPDSERVNVELTAGWNELLVKTDNVYGPWAFYLELRDPTTGNSLSGVEYRITPPSKK